MLVDLPDQSEWSNGPMMKTSHLRIVAAVAMAFVAASCASTQHNAHPIDPNVILSAERQLDPICGRPLSAYRRYYARVLDDGRDVIAGRFVVRTMFSRRQAYSIPVSGTGGAFATSEENLPACEPGSSCNIVHLLLDPNTGSQVALEPEQDGQLSLTTVCMSDTPFVARD